MKPYLKYPKGYDKSKVNGCGPAGWKYDLVPDTIYTISVREACNIHDYKYWSGKTWEDKEAADREFLRDMNLTFDYEAKWSKFLNSLRRVRAAEYYLAVSQAGDNAFLKGKEGFNL